MFTHLHVHSRSSPMQGIATPEALIARVRAYGMTHLVLTDVNGLWGFIDFVRLARQEGIIPLCGSHLLTGPSPKEAPTGDLVLLVKSSDGYANLCRLLSRVHDAPDSDACDLLAEFGDGLFVLCPSPELLAGLAPVVDSDYLFGELRPGQDTTRLLHQCRQLGIKPVATGAVAFLEPGDDPLYRLLRAMDRNERLSDLPVWEQPKSSQFLATEQTIRDRFPQCPEAVDNAHQLALRCKSDWDFSKAIFPRIGPLREVESALRKRVHEGATQRYGKRLPDNVTARIEKELALICEKGFASYFLVVADIVGTRYLTIGRGSGAASIVSYCLFITQVDPIAHNLYFERFLHPERTDLPDIDVDFAWDERDDVQEYVLKTYGRDKAAMVSNQVTLQPRSAVREVGKVYGLTNEEILAVTRRIRLLFAEEEHPAGKDIYPRRHDPLPLASLASSREHPIDITDTLQTVVEQAMRLVGLFHYPSVHSGGMIIVPDDIRQYVPVLTAPKGVPIVQWEKDQVEDAGLVKIDLLGNRSLAVVRDALGHINRYRKNGPPLRYHDIRPVDDPATRRLMESGRTMGIFYIESPATRQLLAKAGKVDFEHVVIYSSIIRPAANRFINLLIERIHGEPWEPYHPDLDALNESYGLMVYQEQVAIVARVMAGYSYGEADQLQKLGTKKSLRAQLPAMRERFIRQSLANGYPEGVVHQVWDMIDSFKGYSFCKPHSASYAMLSFTCAWLKTHHPAEFLAAVISNRGGFYAPYAYMSEARRTGIGILPPHINLSLRAWKGSRGRIRVGFMEINHLHTVSVDALIQARNKADFTSLDDFLSRVDIPFADVRMLIRAGCFDNLEPDRNRPDMMLELMEYTSDSQDVETVSMTPAPTRTAVELRPLTQDQITQMEIDAFGYPLSRHPLEPFALALKGRSIVTAVDLHRHAGRTVTLAGICITTKTIKTRKGEAMEFLTFEDQTDVFECALFPKQYKVFNDLVRWEKLFLVTGKVDEHWGVITLSIQHLESLSRAI